MEDSLINLFFQFIHSSISCQILVKELRNGHNTIKECVVSTSRVLVSGITVSKRKT